jgi:hypothetical protein
VSGKNVSWNEYLAMMIDKIKEMNELVIMVGGDGGLYETVLRGYT